MFGHHSDRLGYVLNAQWPYQCRSSLVKQSQVVPGVRIFRILLTTSSRITLASSTRWRLSRARRDYTAQSQLRILRAGRFKRFQRLLESCWFM